MKKSALVLLAILMVAMIIPSAHAKMKIGVGGDLGFNISTMVSDIAGFDTGKKSRNGLLMGGVLVLNFNEYLAMQPEVRYSMKGFRSKTTQGAAWSETKYNYDYLEIPIYLKFSIPTGIGFGPHFMAGPVFGLKLSSNYDYNDSNGQTQSGTIADQKSIDFGLGFGAGGHYDFGAHGVMLNFIYNLGLTNVNGQPGGADVSNRCLSIVAGYIYTFNK
jgi:hypothetical protein